MEKLLSPQQQQIVAEFLNYHELEPKQISFKGDLLEPIFDYAALNKLRLKLTDLQSVEPVIIERTSSLVTAKCTAVLADGRPVSDLGTAEIGEAMYDGSKIESLIQAQNVAISRSTRRVYVAAGINLMKAHQKFVETGEIVSTEPIDLPRKYQKEIKALCKEWGHSDDQYRTFLQNLFGVRSSTDLNEIQLSQCVNTYRAMLNSRNLATLKAA
jgi:hypothetical protein